MPATLTEPCTLLFAIVLVLVSCAAMLVSLHAIDAHARHDGGPRRRAADGLTPAVERATTAALLLLLLTTVALMCVLLVWAREGEC